MWTSSKNQGEKCYLLRPRSETIAELSRVNPGEVKAKEPYCYKDVKPFFTQLSVTDKFGQ